MADINKSHQENTHVENESDSLLKMPSVLYEEKSPNQETNEKLETEQEVANPPATVPVPKLQCNTRALLKTAETYELETFEKKHLLILNHEEVIGHPPRTGTKKDVDELERTFKRFGFEVKVENDLTYNQIMTTLAELYDQDFTDYGCVVVAVLTHGEQQGLIRAKDMAYNEYEIIKHFNVKLRPTLVTKPKIVIIQACRGEDENSSVTVFGQRGPTQRDLNCKKDPAPYTLPVESDMLILHSSYMGTSSFRDLLNGSWFIQSLCCMINRLASTHDLQSIMVEVNRLVAIELSDNKHDTTQLEPEIIKQMPVITSTLIRKLYLRKFGEITETMQDITPPLTPRSAQCRCHLEHFNYMRKCLKYYIDLHEEDMEARLLYDMVKIFDDRPDYNDVKREMLKVISNYLNGPNVRTYEFRKFLFFY